jgi:hypothetical protein
MGLKGYLTGTVATYGFFTSFIKHLNVAGALVKPARHHFSLKMTRK